MNSRRRLIVLGAALALRVVLIVGAVATASDLRTLWTWDTGSYVAPARSWFVDGTYSVHGLPELKRTPGYSLVLVPGVWADGHVGPALAALAVQIPLALVTVWLVGKTTTDWTGSKGAGLWAAILYAVDPLAAVYSVLVMPESLLAFLVIVAVERTLVARQSGSLAAALIAGLALGVAPLVKPIAAYLPLVFGVAFLIARPLTLRRWGPAALLCCVALLPQAAWRYRNWHVAGYTGLSSISDINAYFYAAAATSAAQQGRSYYKVQRELGYQDEAAYLQLHPEQRTWSEAQRLAFQRREARRIIAAAPVSYARIHAAGMLRVLFDPGAVDLLKVWALYPIQGGRLGRAVDQGIVVALTELVVERPLAGCAMLVLGAWLAMLYVFAAASLVVRRGYGFPGLILVTCLYFVLLSGGPQALARFRGPIVPLICVLAGAGAERWKLLRSASCARPPRSELSAAA